MGKHGRGTVRLGWCRECNLPLLGKLCSRCGGEAEKVEMTPPGDVRPAFPEDVERINDMVYVDFGYRPFPDDRVMLLSKIPAVDRADEVIVDGRVRTAIHFDPVQKRYEVLPRWNLVSGMPRVKRWVDVDHIAAEAIRGGANLMAPGVLDADPDVMEGDEVLLFDDGVPVACGRARMNGSNMAGARGFAVKVRQAGIQLTEEAQQGGQNWQQVVEANIEYIKSMEKRAVDFIKRTAERHPRKLTVSYSGGKDSLATLLLALESGLNFDMIFGDTGLEMPGTVEHVHEISKHYGLTLHMISAGDAFWEHFPSFGPPSVEARWCCKVAKLGPLASMIDEKYPDGTLSLIGQRGLESYNRAQKGDVWKNPWVGNQVGASPIQRWSQLAVWLYIFYKGAPYNPLYRRGFDRLGCFLCPSTSMADLRRVAEAFPDTWARWDDTLMGYCESRGLPREYAEYGFWRRKRSHTVQEELKSRLGLKWEPPRAGDKGLNFQETSGYSPCRDGGVSAELACGTVFVLDDIIHMLRPLGETKISDGLVFVRSGTVSWQVYASGTVVVRASNQKVLRWALDSIKGQLKKAMECTGCGVCVGRCPEKAIHIEGKVAHVDQRCYHCGECLKICPLVKFND